MARRRFRMINLMSYHKRHSTTKEVINVPPKVFDGVQIRVVEHTLITVVRLASASRKPALEWWSWCKHLRIAGEQQDKYGIFFNIVMLNRRNHHHPVELNFRIKYKSEYPATMLWNFQNYFYQQKTRQKLKTYPK